MKMLFVAPLMALALSAPVAAQDSAALEIPMVWAYASLCVGPALVALQLALSRLGRETPAVDPIEW